MALITSDCVLFRSMNQKTMFMMTVSTFFARMAISIIHVTLGTSMARDPPPTFGTPAAAATTR